MNLRSLHLGTYAGIPLKLHWTFALVFVFVIFIGVKNGRQGSEIVTVFLYVIALFLCVVLHEYGHALMAKRFHIKTVDIILSPIGGLARLERLPSKAIHEFYVAIAGPLVNIVIAGLLAVILWANSADIFPNMQADISEISNWTTFLSVVLSMNLVLFFFNLIPAFPMDGGRILRSLLSIQLGKKRSTDISAYIGYAIAVVFVVFGLINSWYTLSFIGVFVMIMARSERLAAKQEDFLMNNYGDQAQFSNSLKYFSHSLLEDIIKAYRQKLGKNFMIFTESEELMGIIPEHVIKSLESQNMGHHPVIPYVFKNHEVYPRRNLKSILNIMKERQQPYLVMLDPEGNYSLVERYKIMQNLPR